MGTIGIVHILAFLVLVLLYLLWGGYQRRFSKFTALWYSGVCVAIGGGLLLLAVLPQNAFYGPTLFKGNTADKVVSLTFDDGPYPVYTEKILRILQDNDIEATFFLVGENIEEHPEIARKVVEAGQIVGIHAYTHKDMLRMNQEEVYQQLEQAKTSVKKHLGQDAIYFRPPHGFKDYRVMAATAKAQVQVVTWSAMGQDWKEISAKQVVENVMKDIHPGSIVLLHDGDSPNNIASRQRTVEALPMLLQALQQEGYRVISLDAMAAYNK